MHSGTPPQITGTPPQTKTIQQHYKQAQIQIQKIRQVITKLHNDSMLKRRSELYDGYSGKNQQQNSKADGRNVQYEISELERLCSQLNNLVLQQVQNRKLWQRHVRSVQEDMEELKREAGKYVQLKSKYEEERELLMGIGHTAKDNTNKEMYATQNVSMDHSIQVLESIKDRGVEVLSMLSTQSSILRRARNRTDLIGSTVRASEKTLRIIERTLKVDAWIVCIGMIIVTLMLIFIWWYVL